MYSLNRIPDGVFMSLFKIIIIHKRVWVWWSHSTSECRLYQNNLTFWRIRLSDTTLTKNFIRGIIVNKGKESHKMSGSSESYWCITSVSFYRRAIEKSQSHCSGRLWRSNLLLHDSSHQRDHHYPKLQEIPLNEQEGRENQ